MRHQLHTHAWSDGSEPHIIRQDADTILHHRCLNCGRDFARGFDGSYAWTAAYVGIFRIEPLADSVTERWLAETCPQSFLDSDIADRELRIAAKQNAR